MDRGRLLVAGGFTLVELLVVIAVIGVAASLAIPGLIRARIAANEASAITSLKSIHEAQVIFRSTCGDDRDFAASLIQLGAARTLSPDLATAATVEKSGYRIALAASEPGGAKDRCTNAETAREWYVAAVPVTPGRSGARAFATAQGEAIWQDLSGVAPKPPFGAGPTVSRVD